MKLSQAKEWLELVTAFANGKTIQFNSGGKWDDCVENGHPQFSCESNLLDSYRIKPEPKLRPWRPEEVPVGAIIKQTEEIRSLILGCNSKGIRVADVDKFHLFPYEWLILVKYTHSTDGGKTFLPCGITE